MKVIIGLGNPGSEYENTPHNVGFMLLDLLAKSLQCSSFRSKFHGEMASGTYGGEPFVLLKPMTYMNHSGESVAACSRFYKTTVEDLVVISDDLELSPGRVRFRLNGGHGGHNGLRSIMEHLQSNEFKRVRVGIGRPGGSHSVSDYVLSPWKEPDFSKIQEISSAVVECLVRFIRTSVFENTSLSVP
ncbi:aminoacyl-tRNA hydrolase [Deltaproteobacteria bacterium TL4]